MYSKLWTMHHKVCIYIDNLAIVFKAHLVLLCDMLMHMPVILLEYAVHIS